MAELDPIPLHSTDSEVDRFFDSGSRLWRKQRAKIEEMQSAYDADRFQLTEAYKRKALALANEMEDSLRDLAVKHEIKLTEAKRMLNALSALRNS